MIFFCINDIHIIFSTNMTSNQDDNRNHVADNHVDDNHVDYVVIDTGYTSRILRADLVDIFFDNCHNEVFCTAKTELQADTLADDIHTNTDVLRILKCVYIKDRLWGTKTDTGTFEMEPNGMYSIDSKDEVEQARFIVETIYANMNEGRRARSSMDGIIVFKNTNLTKAFKLVNFLIDIDYCACFKMSTLDDVQIQKLNGKKVLFLTFDCESG